MNKKILAAIMILIVSIIVDNLARSALINQYNALHKAAE